MVNIALLAAVIVIVVALAVVIVVFRTRIPLLRLIEFGAWAMAVVLAGTAGVAILTVLFGQRVELTVPVDAFWPTPPAGVEIDAARSTVVHGSITEASVTVEGLPLVTRAIIAAGLLLSAIAPVALALGIARLVATVRSGRLFIASLRRTAWFVIASLLVSGVFGQLSLGIGFSIASSNALESSGMTITGYPEAFSDFFMSIWPRPGVAIDFDFGPLITAAVAAIIVEVLAAGERLQRDNMELSRATEGLV